MKSFKKQLFATPCFVITKVYYDNHDLTQVQQQEQILDLQDKDTCKNVYEIHCFTSSWFNSLKFLCKLYL